MYWQSTKGSIRLEKMVNTTSENLDHLLFDAIAKVNTGDLNSAEIICDKILLKYPSCSDAYNILGVIAIKVKKVDTAIELFYKAIDLNNSIAAYHNNIALAYIEIENIEKAQEHLKIAFKLDSTNPESYSIYGTIKYNQNKFQEAETYLKKSLQQKPDSYHTRNLLGLTLYQLDKITDAISEFEKLIESNSEIPDAFNNLGIIYHFTNKPEKAIYYYERALKLKPDFYQAYNNLGMVYQSIGELKQAQKHFKSAIKLNPLYAACYKNYTLSKKFKITENETQLLVNTILDNVENTTNMEDKTYYNFALGKIMKDCKKYNDAFKYIKLGNKYKRKILQYNSSDHSDLISKIINVFDTELFQKFHGKKNNTNLPLFIIGMPRSGTTLVEQIISSHPDIYGAGELNYFTNLEKRLSNILKTKSPYPECINLIDQDYIEIIHNEYINYIKHYSSTAKFISDKMPDNFMRLGLISLMFPNAPIIHCKRDPIATCVSIYFQFFTGHNPYAYDLTEIGKFYCDYIRIMKHWKKTLPNPMFEVSYENIINDRINISKELISFLGLEWNENCYNYINSKKSVLTASSWQVRQPIYKHAINDWKNYEKYLKNLIEELKNIKKYEME